ncbi:MAG TPA: hypothetical protein VFK07_01765 [Candidatus Paceibacterota bacterium]|nr:hypothetical protein [Candidatus Paceibacterota bacterium]HZZ99415.1 hypothetical protein [Candidatus Paceibacterota bacterium]
MSLKSWVTLFLVLGSVLGAYVPGLWGDQSLISIASILFSGLGGIIGAIIGYKLYQYLS